MFSGCPLTQAADSLILSLRKSFRQRQYDKEWEQYQNDLRRYNKLVEKLKLLDSMSVRYRWGVANKIDKNLIGISSPRKPEPPVVPPGVNPRG